jgi:Raf kinase inhibitor-like YbhB/YbcL family protein
MADFITRRRWVAAWVSVAVFTMGLSGELGCSKQPAKEQAAEPVSSGPPTPEKPTVPEGKVADLKIESQAFSHQGEIPKKYSCQGQDLSPPLSWGPVPEAAKSLALIVDDPDAPDPAAPKRVWVHWVLYDIPPTEKGLDEGAKQPPAGAKDGLNDWGRPGYGGPCPPIGRHRYFFKLYALDVTLDDLERPKKADLEKAMVGHILAQGELIGTYQK